MLAGSGALAAAPPPGGGSDVDAGGVSSEGHSAVPLDTVGGVTTIASPPEPGVLYATRCMYDFSPFASDAVRQWGGNGVYSATNPSAMRATVDLPAGALLHDMEWYVYNNGGLSRSCDLLRWTASSGTLSLVAQLPFPPGAGVRALRVVIPEVQRGPFPSGIVFIGTITTPDDGTVQVNGFRLGYTLPAVAAAPSFHPIAPQRVYDSRHGDGRMARNTSRTVSVANGLDAGGTVVAPDAVPPGATAIVANVTVSGPTGPNYLSVVPGGSSGFTTSTINFPGGFDAANGTTVLLGADRMVTIFCGDQTGSTDVIIDVTGYYA